MPVSFTDQLNKYAAKYDGTNVTTVLTAILTTVVEPRYEAAISAIVADREAARKVIEEAGVPPGRQALYFAFAQALSSAKLSHSGSVLALVAQALKARFVAMGADATVIDQLISALIGTVSYY
ncbi:MAG: hypothetical protein QW733_02005 [Desulfurococcaceae archaeon]|uniref:hypothetical protein n=1 Tax=Desulfurococcus sp. TaxID=51678 RepID=UPI003164A00E